MKDTQKIISEFLTQSIRNAAYGKPPISLEEFCAVGGDLKEIDKIKAQARAMSHGFSYTPYIHACMAQSNEDTDPFPVDWSLAPEGTVCATYSQFGTVMFWAELVRETQPADVCYGSVPWVRACDGLDIEPLDVEQTPLYKPVGGLSYSGSLRMRPTSTTPQALSPTGDRWNTTCGQCGAPAYQGFMEVECSRGCQND